MCQAGPISSQRIEEAVSDVMFQSPTSHITPILSTRRTDAQTCCNLDESKTSPLVHPSLKSPNGLIPLSHPNRTMSWALPPILIRIRAVKRVLKIKNFVLLLLFFGVGSFVFVFAEVVILLLSFLLVVVGSCFYLTFWLWGI